MKEDSFANWLFQRKWLVLREQTPPIHKNEVRLLTYLNVLPLLKVLQTAPQKSVIMLNGIFNIECILSTARKLKPQIAMKCSTVGRMGISNPTNFVHKVHVGLDPVSGAFTAYSSRFAFYRVPLSFVN